MKKSFCAFIIAIAVILPAISQNFSQDKLYERKIENFSRLKNIGYSMVGVGAGLSTVGAVLLITLPDEYWNGDDWNYDDMGDTYNHEIQFIAGVIFTGMGIGFLAGGLTMTSISNRKIKLYKGKTSDLSLGMLVDARQQGFKITYRF